MENSEEQVGKWVGPKFMEPQHYLFADTYMSSKGKYKTYKHAAIVAGQKEASAHTIGSRWAKYTAIQNYWAEIRSMYHAQLKDVHYQSILELQELASDKKAKLADKIVIHEMVADKTKDAMYAPVVEGAGAVSADEKTSQTMSQIMTSIQALLVGEPDDE